MKSVDRRLLSGGFTLLEVLIGITIFAICLAAVYGLYASVTTVVQNVEQQAADSRKVGIALEQLSFDLRGLIRGRQGMLLGSQAEESTGEEPFLEFISSNHLSFAPDAAPVSRTIIRYYLRRSGSDQPAELLRSDSPVAVGHAEGEDPAEASRFILCQGLSEVKLVFTGLDNEETTAWDSRRDQEQDQQAEPVFPLAVSLALVPAAATEQQTGSDAYGTAVYLRPALLEFEDGAAGE